MMDSLDPAALHFGEQKRIQLPGITLAIIRMDKTRRHVDWHSHENSHFTFIIQGKVIEGTRKEVFDCSAGTLLFHSGSEPHYNIKLEGHASCFHVDFDQNHLDDLAHDKNELRGIFNVRNSGIKLLCYKIFREAVSPDDLSPTSIHNLSLEILGKLLFGLDQARTPKPSWVDKLEEILRTGYSENLPLDALSRELSIHPVHLSRSFSQYFHCTLGEYVRSIRIERSLAFMSRRHLSLTDIAFKCGFADQSHFTRSFKRIIGVSPSTYRKSLA